MTDESLKSPFLRAVSFDTDGERHRFVGHSVRSTQIEERRSLECSQPMRRQHPLSTACLPQRKRASQRTAFRDVALKSLTTIRSEKAVRRFELEIEVLATLDCDRVARIVDGSVVHDGLGERPWFAMELVQGAKYVTS